VFSLYSFVFCLRVCLSVCLSTRLVKMLWTDFYETLLVDEAWAKNELIRFWM